ncbi:RICIN domain-containing protein [Micromonospora sp. NPDC049559]|uniref:RICIN domain-containing protein n=1 Tax=Micromonospora sp. NPDC049559 TaxID=3155923 RepID=UPI00342A54DA
MSQILSPARRPYAGVTALALAATLAVPGAAGAAPPDGPSGPGRPAAASAANADGSRATANSGATNGASVTAGADVTADAGQRLGSDQAMYPRAIRLEHSGAANGSLVASVSTSSSGGVTDSVAFFESADAGASFQRVGTLSDPQAAQGRGSCCGSLFELPRQLGTQPAGTLLYATTVGLPDAPGRVPEIRVWSSTDRARSWRYLSSCASAPSTVPAGRGLWEPELSVDARGYLNCYYSDDARPGSGYDQVLAVVTSTDGGASWSGPRDVVAIPSTATTSYRPGMAGVRQLPNGSYFMSYEVCGSGLPDSCVVRYRTSADGWNWGDPGDPGTVTQTVGGRRLFHAPTVAWAPGGGPNGRILLIGGLVKDATGRIMRPNSGSTVLVNTANGAGAWSEVDAPVTVEFSPEPDHEEIVCSNYSSSLVPSADGTRVLELATRRQADGTCAAFFATGPATATPTSLAATRTYRLRAAVSGHCLDVTGGSVTSGTKLQQWNCNSLDPQNWKVTAVAGGYLTLTSEQSGMCLDVPGSSTTNGVRLQQWTCNNTRAQQWRAVSVGRDAYTIVSAVSGLCLDVADASTAPAAAVRQWTCDGTRGQLWDAERALTVLPLGDSITDGLDGTGGYRADLWQLFRADGGYVDFVGSQFAGPERLGDRDHEGHPGWRIDQIDAQATAWMTSYQPDVVLLHVGTNDVIQNYAPSQAPSRLSALVDHLGAAVPAADILVSTIVPFADAPREALTRAYNATIPPMVAAKAGAGKRVRLVDLHAALTPADLLADGVHPSNGGYSKMAVAWYAALTGRVTSRTEAESGTNTLVDAVTVATVNASGNLKVGHLDNPGSYLEFTVTATQRRTYRMYVRAANGTETPCGHAVTVNGSAPRRVSYPNYGWDQWAVVAVNVALHPGTNTIRFAHDTCYAELDAVNL